MNLLQNEIIFNYVQVGFTDIERAFRGGVCMNALSIPAQHRAFSFRTVAFALATLSNCAQTRFVLSALYHLKQLREVHSVANVIKKNFTNLN
jgi:hypothetical protein